MTATPVRIGALLVAALAVAILLVPAQAQPGPEPLKPFDPVPAITLPTTDGEITIGGDPGGTESHVLLGYSSLSALSAGLWSGSLELLLAESPRDVHYVFLSYTEEEAQHAAEIADIQARAEAAVAGLPDAADRDHWAGHLHFVSANPLALPEPVPGLLTEWGPTLAEVSATWTDAQGVEQSVLEIGTTDSGWAVPLTATGPISAPLGLYGSPGSEEALACAGAEPTGPITGTIALIERGVCPFVDKAMNAYAHGAIGALVYTDDRDRVTMGGSCEVCPQIPVVMIDRAPGLSMSEAVEAGIPVVATLAPRKIGVELMAVDHQSRARELGSVPFPFNSSLPRPIDDLQMVAFGSQYFHYEHVRDTRLAEEAASGKVTELPVFVDEWADDPGWAGKRSYADVTLPDAATMATFDTLEVDLGLSCPDHFRSNCPPWDYIVDMFLCDSEDPDSCDLLIGRWISPYWAEGRWVTDITPMLGWLSEGGPRRFAFYTQQRYGVDLTLRLSNRGKDLVPKRAIDLGLNGGPFWDDYNGRFQPIEFEVPEWAEKVEIASYVTGHGFGKDAENCAEFCNHTHHISVNGSEEHVKRHPEAQTLMGCTEQVPDGVVPNQGGTWIYGRGGWCPGLDVTPWVIDVTQDVAPGERNRLTYRGLFNGQDYEPEPADPANPEPFDALIRMRSYMVFSAAPDVEAPPVAPPYPTVTPTPTATPMPTPTPTAEPADRTALLPWAGRRAPVGGAAVP